MADTRQREVGVVQCASDRPHAIVAWVVLDFGEAEFFHQYMSVVLPTWQTIAGGSRSSSRYIVYSDDPGGVFSCHGSPLVPVPGMGGG